MLREGGEIVYQVPSRTWSRSEGGHVHRKVEASTVLERRILEGLRVQGPCALRELIKSLKVPRRTLDRSLAELVERGLVRRGGRARGTTYQLAAG